MQSLEAKLSRRCKTNIVACSLFNCHLGAKLRFHELCRITQSSTAPRTKLHSVGLQTVNFFDHFLLFWSGYHEVAMHCRTVITKTDNDISHLPVEVLSIPPTVVLHTAGSFASKMCRMVVANSQFMDDYFTRLYDLLDRGF